GPVEPWAPFDSSNTTMSRGVRGTFSFVARSTVSPCSVLSANPLFSGGFATHLRTMSVTSASSGNGSIAIIGAARCGLLAADAPDVPEPDRAGQHGQVLGVSKSTRAMTEPTLRSRTPAASIPGGTPDEPFPTLKVDWLGYSALSGDAIVARESARPD